MSPPPTTFSGRRVWKSASRITLGRRTTSISASLGLAGARGDTPGFHQDHGAGVQMSFDGGIDLFATSRLDALRQQCRRERGGNLPGAIDDAVIGHAGADVIGQPFLVAYR